MVHRPHQHKHILHVGVIEKNNNHKTSKIPLPVCGYELESRLGYCDSIFVNTLKRYGFDPIWDLKGMRYQV